MVWTPQQAGAFLDHAAGDRSSALFETVAATGMRRAEVCGLPRADVDLHAGVITVRATRIAMGREVHDDTPKSEAGRRDIALDERTITVLRAHFARQAAERLAWGEAGRVRTGVHEGGRVASGPERGQRPVLPARVRGRAPGRHPPQPAARRCHLPRSRLGLTSRWCRIGSAT
ncbi:MAG TPA: hypothetical protein VGI66_17000 [Streptosporangiaceae bacterium]|jgi:integrase